MSVVYRYEIPIDDQWHEVPAGKVVMAAPYRKIKRDRIEVWIELRGDGDTTGKSLLRVYGTGHPVPENVEHRASVRDDPFVWHVFEDGGKAHG